jgi:pimeloyl-ACP methyl ester carboxylesterase
MRAREPDADGFVDRGPVRLHWERFGDGDPTLLLLPTWTIIHARFWKAQVPYLARHFRVVTYDGPGNGRSDRPPDAEPYGCEEQARAASAVLDATGTDRAVLVSLSMGALWALWLMANQPQRVLGSVFIGPSVPLGPGHEDREQPFEEPYTSTEGWAKYNRHYWLREYRDFLEFFASEAFSETHSTKPIEDMVGWGLETSPETLVLTQLGAQPASRAEVEAILRRIRCPVLVVHGSDDRVRPHAVGAAVAELTGGRLVTVEGGGHCPQARHPVRVNLLIREFVESLGGTVR